MTSYLSFYKSGGLINNPPIYEISNESIVARPLEGLKKLFNYIVNLFKKVFTWIKNKINNVLKSRIFKIKIEKIKKRRATNEQILVSTGDFTKILSKSIRSVSGVSLEDTNDKIRNHFSNYGGTYVYLLFNEDGSIYNPNQLINRCTNFIERVFRFIDNGGAMSLNEGRHLDISSTINEFTYLFEDSHFQWYRENTLNKITFKEIYKHVNDTDKIISDNNLFYNKYKKEIELRINKLSNLIKAGTGDLETINEQLSMLNTLLKVCTAPLNVFLLYCNLLSVIDNEVMSIKHIGEDIPENIKLYHLSISPNLNNTLYPQLPESGGREYLPPRTSFSPTIEQCTQGINHHLIVIGVEDVIQYKELYLYEGIPDKDTKCVKKDLMRFIVGDSGITDEIAVLTPIKIKYISKINIKYKVSNKRVIYLGHEEI